MNIEIKWKLFSQIKKEVYLLIEQAKQNKEIKDPKEAKITLTKDHMIEGFDMKRFLNVAEIHIGERMTISKTDLKKCERCQRHKENIGAGYLCQRCLCVIKNNLPDDMNIEEYVKSFELDEEEEKRLIKALRDKK